MTVHQSTFMLQGTLRLTKIVLMLAIAAALSHRADAGHLAFWTPTPESYNAHLCPSSLTVVAGQTITLALKNTAQCSSTYALDNDTYHDIYGNTRLEEDPYFSAHWVIKGPSPSTYHEELDGLEWPWVAPCEPGTYHVSVTLSDSGQPEPGRRDGQATREGNVIVTAANISVSFAVPGEGEFVTGTTTIKAYANDPINGIASVQLWMFSQELNEWFLKSSLSPCGQYWVGSWNTLSTGKGNRIIQLVATNTKGCSKGSELRGVFLHPIVCLESESFNQDHVLFDRDALALISRPQWRNDGNNGYFDKPIAYSHNSQMQVTPTLTSTDVNVPVYLRYTVNMLWDDSTSHSAEKTAEDVTFPYSQLSYYPTSRNGVRQYTAYEDYAIYIRKYSNDDWCLSGQVAPVHNQIYLTLAEPSYPWGSSRHLWTDVLHEACNWANGESTAASVLTQITIGLHSRTSHEYKYNRGGASFSLGILDSEILYLNCLLNTPSRQGDCRDFSNCLCAFANAVGVGLETRVLEPPGGFYTNTWYPAGLTGPNAVVFVFHQYGMYSTVFDAAIRFAEGGDPPTNIAEENGTLNDYESAIVDPNGQHGTWTTRAPQKPAIAIDRWPTLTFRQVTPTQTTAYIQWLTNVPSATCVHWDISPHSGGGANAYQYHTPLDDGFPLESAHSFNITPLDIGRRYYYRIEYTGQISDEFYFDTLPEE